MNQIKTQWGGVEVKWDRGRSKTLEENFRKVLVRQIQEIKYFKLQVVWLQLQVTS